MGVKHDNNNNKSYLFLCFLQAGTRNIITITSATTIKTPTVIINVN